MLGALLLSLSPLGAQQEEEAFSDVVDVNVVSIEVVVTDGEGRPVDGLTKDDFELRVDGELQELSNFYAVQRSASRGSAEQAPSEVTLPPDGTAGLTVLLFIDNLNIRPENRKALLDQLRGYVDQLIEDEREPRHSRGTSATRFMVVSHGRGMEVLTPLTNNPDTVWKAFTRIESKTSLHAARDGSRRMFMSRLGHASLRRYQPPPLGDGDPQFDDAIRVALDLMLAVRSLAEERYQTTKATFEAMGYLAESLAGLPGRKAMLYLSDGLPLRPADSLFDAWAGKYQNWFYSNASDIRLRSKFPEAASEFQSFLTSVGSSQFDLQNQLNRLVTKASGAQVAFYPVSLGGRASGMMSAEVSGAAMHGDVGGGGMGRQAMLTESLTRDASLLRLAEDTGGVAHLRSADLSAFLDRLRRDFTNYYSLGFPPPEGENDGRPRSLAIRVKAPGLEVRHAKAYVAKNWRQRLGERTAAAALSAVESNPLGVQVDPGVEIRDGDHFVVPIMIKIPFENIKLVHSDSNFNAQLTVLLLVSDAAGALSQSHRIDIPIKIPDSRVLEVLEQTAAYPIDLKMREGPARIAVGVRDHLSGSEAAVNLEINVGRGVPLGG